MAQEMASRIKELEEAMQIFVKDAEAIPVNDTELDEFVNERCLEFKELLSIGKHGKIIKRKYG